MPPNDAAYPREWVAIAEKDRVRVDRALRDNDPELAGFCLQQAVEKLLKGFLLSRGWRLQRVHNLVSLLEDAIMYEPTFDRFRAPCEEISGFYIATRYILSSPITEEQVREARDEIQDLIDAIRAAFLPASS